MKYFILFGTILLTMISIYEKEVLGIMGWLNVSVLFFITNFLD